jgi:biopolymer transport protein ExbD
MNELNITPLLDLAFVLLVIFIITTPQMTNELEMNLPSPKKNNVVSPPPRLNYILVNEAGKITFNQKPVEVPELKETLIRLKADDPDTGVVVKGAAGADYQNVITVLDVLQQVEVTKVGLATETAN